MDDETGRPSRVPLAMSIAGFALLVWGSLLAWFYPYGNRHRPLDGFDGGWLTAHLAGHFDEFGWHAGADAWPALLASLAAIVVALANLRARVRRYDRVQLALGLLVVAIVVYNWVWMMHFAGDHWVIDSGFSDGRTDSPGVGLWMTLLAGLITSAGALLGNTPEFRFDPEPGEAPEATL